MHESRRVSLGENVAHRNEDLRASIEAQDRPFLELVGQGPPLEELRDQVWDAR